MVISMTHIFKTTKYVHREQSHKYLQIFLLILWLLLLLQLPGTWIGCFKIYSHLVRPPLPFEEKFSLWKVSLFTVVCVMVFLDLNRSQSSKFKNVMIKHLHVNVRLLTAWTVRIHFPTTLLYLYFKKNLNHPINCMKNCCTSIKSH